ncbi:M3 family oligoendopeptidase [Reyranella aquatilis]|uniref:M3 family oligoendopeptidase n=1 Tax=Reyranella aquatilis TaxID=2035356 RepID=A0ABS8KPU7_9HYPH|nr:M3 family oligoendopeptidase [Reyranella aquatilis]MCC8428068.1 M3 family oligoendopeptidase [Reyranella aquatilis]
MNVVLGDLPTWNLGDLYSSPTGTDLGADLKRAASEADAFSKDYEGRLAGLDGKGLGGAIARLETMSDLLGRIGSYAQLYSAQDQSDPERNRFAQDISEKLNDIGSKLLFFRLEINKIEDADLAEKLKAPELAKYAPWLRDARLFRPHQLSDELEKFQHDQSVVGSSAWSRLFDETIARLRYPFRNEMLSEPQILDKLSNKDATVRKEAAKSFGKVQGDNIAIFSLITNTLIKDKEIDDRWRRYARPQSFRNLANVVEDEVVDALAESVKAAYPKLAHRYYKLKAKWFGVETMPYWDRNAPLPEHDDRTIPWPEAEKIVLDAYNAFSPELADVGRKFFGTGWIDAPARPGKSPGAFAHPTVPSAHPYLLLNYQGKVRDVMTLAHELGHGVHQVLAAKQGPLMADTPLTLAETASVFGEMLTFQSLLKTAPDKATRKAMLAGKVEDMLNTVVRQIAFYDFESRLHMARREGELTPDAIGEIWMAVQKESLGPAFTFDDEYKYYWSYIGHFIHSPFYVYAYAFGDCLVNSLYAAYQAKPDGFQEKYLDMLRSGGVKRHKELLAPFGLDASDPAFWDRGLDVISGFIDELEKL